MKVNAVWHMGLGINIPNFSLSLDKSKCCIPFPKHSLHPLIKCKIFKKVFTYIATLLIQWETECSI